MSPLVRFGIVLLLILGVFVASTWSDFKYVMSCVLQEDNNYMNQAVVETIDQKLITGVTVEQTQNLFLYDIPQGTFESRPCIETGDFEQCGENFYTASYPFGVHDCICGRPNRFFTLEFDDNNTLVSLNFIDRKVCT